jgi:hypothetical protein
MPGDWYWWLVTWGTYGAWLPGDPRGFRTWRRRQYVPPPAGRALSGEAIYHPQAFEKQWQQAKQISGKAVCFNEAQQQIVLDAIVADLAELPIEPKIMAVTGVHIHLLAVFGESGIRPTVGRLKAQATKSLKEQGQHLSAVRNWAKGCHMESLEADDDQAAAYEYVRQHASQGLVYSWIARPGTGNSILH